MALVTYKTARRADVGGVDYFQVNSTTTDMTTAQSLVPAKTGFYGIVDTLSVNASSTVIFQLVKGSTTMVGPLTGSSFYISSMICLTAGATIKMSTAATATVTVYGHYHYEQYLS